MKLRIKLAIDFLLNLNLLEIDPFEATKYINYLINFAKIQYTYTGTDDKGSAITPIQSGWDVLENKLS